MPDFGQNDWIDTQLRNVPVPPDLLARLAQCGPTAPGNDDDARLDAALRDVPVPLDLESKLRRIARHRRPQPLWRQVAVAAGVFLATGLGALGAWDLINGVLQSGQTPVAQHAEPPRPTEGSSQFARRRAAPPLQPISQTDAATSRNSNHSDPQAGQFLLPMFQDVAAMGASLKQKFEARQRSQSTLGAGGAFDPLPELDALEAPMPRGIVPPRARGYDLLFQLKHGEHPFVSPAAHKDLATSRAPFTFRTTSFDLALQRARSGQLLASEEIRVEDFLAAMSYALPPAPESGLSLHVAGSPSPLGDDGLFMLQLSVQAASNHAAPHRPTRLVTLVDTSTAMGSGARWEIVHRALAKLAETMTDEDRLTLIGFAEQPRVLSENATPHDLRALLASAPPRPAGSADLSVGIQAACDAVRGAGWQDAQRVIVITAGRGGIDEPALEKTALALAQLADAKVPWHIVRLGSAEEPKWAQLAERGHGHVMEATSADEIYQSFVSQLSDRTPIVAREASLKLTFNRQSVTGYRLLGHEAVTLTGPATDPLTVDLNADQTATNLYEIWIKPGADPVAVAELTWRDPAGETRSGPCKRSGTPSFRARSRRRPPGFNKASWRPKRPRFYAAAIMPRRFGRWDG